MFQLRGELLGFAFGPRLHVQIGACGQPAEAHLFMMLKGQGKRRMWPNAHSPLSQSRACRRGSGPPGHCLSVHFAAVDPLQGPASSPKKRVLFIDLSLFILIFPSRHKQLPCLTLRVSHRAWKEPGGWLNTYRRSSVAVHEVSVPAHVCRWGIIVPINGGSLLTSKPRRRRVSHLSQAGYQTLLSFFQFGLG